MHSGILARSVISAEIIAERVKFSPTMHKPSQFVTDVLWLFRRTTGRIMLEPGDRFEFKHRYSQTWSHELTGTQLSDLEHILHTYIAGFGWGDVNVRIHDVSRGNTCELIVLIQVRRNLPKPLADQGHYCYKARDAKSAPNSNRL